MTGASPDGWVGRTTDVLHRRCGDAVIVLPRGSGELRRLEGVAAAVWSVVEEPMPLSALLDGACRAADRSPGDDEVTTNVLAAVEALAAVGLLARSEQAPAGSGAAR